MAQEDKTPLKARPSLSYAVLCGLPPQDYKATTNLLAIANEILADRFPYTKQLYLVAGWQRGIGVFEFAFRISDEDGSVLAESPRSQIPMTSEGTDDLVQPLTLKFGRPGFYLVEGFLDGKETFKITFRVLLKTEERR